MIGMALQTEQEALTTTVLLFQLCEGRTRS